jgi:hypothetical protein
MPNPEVIARPGVIGGVAVILHQAHILSWGVAEYQIAKAVLELQVGERSGGGSDKASRYGLQEGAGCEAVLPGDFLPHAMQVRFHGCQQPL